MEGLDSICCVGKGKISDFLRLKSLYTRKIIVFVFVRAAKHKKAQKSIKKLKTLQANSTGMAVPLNQ